MACYSAFSGAIMVSFGDIPQHALIFRDVGNQLFANVGGKGQVYGARHNDLVQRQINVMNSNSKDFPYKNGLKSCNGVSR